MDTSSGSIVTSADATAQEELHASADKSAVTRKTHPSKHRDMLDVWKYGSLATMKFGKRPFPASDPRRHRRKAHATAYREDVYGEPHCKRYRPEASPINPGEITRTFKITTGKGVHRRDVNATFVRDDEGNHVLQLRVPNWEPLPPFEPIPKTAAMFAEQMKTERLTSICSYHDIKSKKEYFHCIWQIENPARSGFFRKDMRRSRAPTVDEVVPDVTISGPIFDGAFGTSWQAIAYPYGYRTDRREDAQLVAMAVRYQNGPESQVNAGFQISLLAPDKLNYAGLQETIREHTEKLKESSRRSNLFKRGKKGWVLRKFSNRTQIRQHRKNSLVFVFSFCVYIKEQTHHRHRFVNPESSGAEEEIAARMKTLWNNGSPSGKIRMEAKNGKIFKVHPVALQLNGGALACLATRFDPAIKPSLQFPDLTEAVLRKVLEYCYTLSVTRLDRTPFEVLLAAHRYGIKGLQSLAEREVVQHIDIECVLDLYVWNEALCSVFLAPFISMFLSLNYGAVKQLPDYDEKLNSQQQKQLEERFGGTQWEDQGFCDSADGSDDGQEFVDSDLDSDEELMFDDDDGMADDDEDNDDGQPALQGEEPEEPQPALPTNGDDHAAAAAADQAVIIANMLDDFEIDPEALEFFLLLM